MEISFICPTCFQEITADSAESGADATCPTCEAALKVPAPGQPSTVRLGGYVLEKSLGQGRLGMVYKATQTTMNRPVALKILSPDLTADEAYVRRFVGEIRAAAQIEHPHVVKLFDVGEAEGRVYAAMSLIEGKSLEQRLREEGPLPEAEALQIALTIAKTLQYVWDTHQVLHHNLNPSNVYLDRHGQVKLMNVGVTRHQGDSPDPDASATMTAMLYMSPEQAGGSGQDVRSDMYSLGVTLFQVLTREVPFKDSPTAAPSLRTLRPELGEATELVVQTLLARDPTHRYPRWGECAADLERVVQGQRPLRQPDGTIMTAEAAAAVAAEAPGKRTPSLRLKRDHGTVAEPPPPAPTAPAAAEAPPAAAPAVGETVAETTGTPTMQETRQHLEADALVAAAEPLPGKPPKKRLPAKYRVPLQVLIGLITLAVAFKYGFGPLLSAARQSKTNVYVINSTGKDWNLNLGWRMLRKELRKDGFAWFELYVGMAERQGLVGKTPDGSEKHKVKVPMRPGGTVLVNFQGARTFYLYDNEKIKTATLARLPRLAEQILKQDGAGPDAAEQVANEARELGRKAFVEQNNWEIVDVNAFQTRVVMVGSSPESSTKEILTDSACLLTIANGRLTYDHGKPNELTVDVPLGQTATVTLPLETKVQVAEGSRLTLTVNGETLAVRVQTQSQKYKHAGIEYSGAWTYTATRVPKRGWDWTWTFGGQGTDAKKAPWSVSASFPKTGNPVIKAAEVKR